MELPSLNFPKYNFTIKASGNGGDGRIIFDKIRLKYVALTPEEWVRQHLIAFLLVNKGFPKGLIAIEKEIKVNALNKRFDALVYDRNHAPMLLMECKAPTVPIGQEVFDQAARYNYLLKVPFLLLTNGMETYFLSVNPIKGSYDFLDDIPDYDKIVQAYDS